MGTHVVAVVATGSLPLKPTNQRETIMALGTSRTRNWGKEAQQSALRIAMFRGKVDYQIRGGCLFLAGSNGQITLPFNESCARLVHVRRGRWEARSHWDDRKLASGVSERDVIRATINAIWS